MSKKKSNLTVNRQKGYNKKEIKKNRHTFPNRSTQKGQKRKFTCTPNKRNNLTPVHPGQLRSPYKSPLYKASPVHKRQRRLFARSLFGVSDESASPTAKDITNEGEAGPTVSDHDPSVEEELQKLLPEVIKILSDEGRLDITLLNFFKQVKDGVFPLDNISFLLWCEVVQWFQLSSTTQMRYSKQSKLFWKLGYRLIGERFVNFMSGPKSHGETILNVSERGYYCPTTSQINFAVPNQRILRSFDPYNVQGERKPGVYVDTMSDISSNLERKSACLTFDGKKIKQGLTNDSGDVDLLGFEKGETLKEKQDKLEEDLRELTSLQNQIHDLQSNETNIQSLPESYKTIVKKTLQKRLCQISVNIFQVEELKRKKEYCKLKLIERGGNQDWRKSKFVYAISAVIAFLYDIDKYLEHARAVTDTMRKYLSSLNGKCILEGKYVCLNSINTYFEIDPNVGEHENTRLTKQRTDEWQDLRSQAKVTGSTLYDALGCGGLEKQKNHFEKVICGVPQKPPSVEAKAAMEHGVKNEVNAVSTILGRVMPAIEPDLVFCEEGCVTVKSETGEIFMVVSPDGSLRRDPTLDSTSVAIEIKCPVRSVHTEFPARYLLQCLAEINALNVEYLLYVSWTEAETTVFKLERDDELFREAMEIAMQLYGTKDVKRPVKLSPEQIRLRHEICKKSKTVPLIGRFESCKVFESENLFNSEEYTNESFRQLLQEISELVADHYELNRERASEAVVFLVADLDRSWQRDKLRCAPVAWFPKGYSLTADTMREISEYVHEECHSRGIHIPCASFDGQWHKLAVRSKEGKPLTILQLQKDLWQEVEKSKKKSILDGLKEMNKVRKWSFVVREVESGNGETVKTSVIDATNGGRTMPHYRPSQPKPNIGKKDQEVISQTQTLANSLPRLVEASTPEGTDVLAVSVADKVEQEVFACNVNEEEWVCELTSEITQGDDERHEDHVDSASEPIEISTPDEISVTREQDKDQAVRISGLTNEDSVRMLNLFKVTKDCNKGNKWDDTTPEDFLEYFQSTDLLQKFLDVELRVVVRYLKKTRSLKIKESVSKKAKIQEVAKILKLKIDENRKDDTCGSKRVKKQVPKLADLAFGVVNRKLTKHELNIMHAEYLWPDRLNEWTCDIKKETTVDGFEYQWFYKPDFSLSRQQYEVRCIDSTHLMTRTRRHCCKGGVENLGNESWLRVAKSGKTFLTPAMVEEVTDPMSIKMASTHFSESVESVMRSNGDEKSAELCKDVRQWWESEDKSGISAAKRHSLRQGLRHRLLAKANFGTFPPATMYIHGWPIQLWEALVANIDAKAWLYCLCKGGSYNARAFSSMIGETFFAELTLNDKRGHGTVSCQEFGQFIGNAVEQIQIRLDPERTFSYTTSVSTVYTYVDKADPASDMRQDSSEDFSKLPDTICTRDHAFDAEARGRLKGRRKTATISTNRNALQKGSLGVRWEGARTNQSKMLPSQRMGINDMD